MTTECRNYFSQVYLHKIKFWKQNTNCLILFICATWKSRKNAESNLKSVQDFGNLN